MWTVDIFENPLISTNREGLQYHLIRYLVFWLLKSRQTIRRDLDQTLISILSFRFDFQSKIGVLLFRIFLEIRKMINCQSLYFDYTLISILIIGSVKQLGRLFNFHFVLALWNEDKASSILKISVFIHRNRGIFSVAGDLHKWNFFRFQRISGLQTRFLPILKLSVIWKLKSGGCVNTFVFCSHWFQQC